jgi:hypothetical protein
MALANGANPKSTKKDKAANLHSRLQKRQFTQKAVIGFSTVPASLKWRPIPPLSFVVFIFFQMLLALQQILDAWQPWSYCSKCELFITVTRGWGIPCFAFLP